MGCGSSSTKVETFRNPQDNQTHQISSPKPVHVTARPQSDHSKTTSRSSSASSKGKHKHDGDQKVDHLSRNSSANTKRTYTVEQNQEPNRDFFVNENLEEKEADKIHSNEEQTDSVEKQTYNVSHLLDDDERIILENGLCVLDIPDIDETRQMKDYTIDDLADDRSLFKYGRKVYSNDMMQSIIKERVRQYAKCSTVPELVGIRHPVRLARWSGVTRKELRQLLPVCQVGNFVDLPTDQCLSRMKQCVENILEPDAEIGDDSQYVIEYKQQLSRWLQRYPEIPIGNNIPDYNTDPNELVFPIAIDDPLSFRKWIEEWELFETEVPETGAWNFIEYSFVHDPKLAEEFHNHYASIVKSRNDISLDDFDMTIDGEAAWNVIELNIVKNDTATEQQLKIWSLREKRTNLHDPEWMKGRRRQIEDIMLNRHDTWAADVMEPYLSFAEQMEEAWRLFQEVCDKYFDPPQKYKLLYSTYSETNRHSANHIDGQARDRNDNSSTDVLTLDDEVNSGSSEAEYNYENSEDGELSKDGSNENNNEQIDDIEISRDNEQDDNSSEIFNDESNENNDEQIDYIEISKENEQDDNSGEVSSKDGSGKQPVDESDKEQTNDRVNSSDNKSTDGTVNGEGNAEDTPSIRNAQQVDDRPQIETMDSGLELDTSDAFYK